MRRKHTPVLLTHEEIRGCVSEYYEEEGKEIRLVDELSNDDKSERVRGQIGFLRAYLMDISFDQGPFDNWVSRLLANHNNKDWTDGYSFFFGQSGHPKTPSNGSWHFSGSYANLFCARIREIDFASAMNALPFDRLVIRNSAGRDWVDTEIRSVLSEIEHDLEFDDLGAGLAKEWLSGSYLFLYATNPWWLRETLRTAKKGIWTQKARRGVRPTRRTERQKKRFGAV